MLDVIYPCPQDQSGAHSPSSGSRKAGNSWVMYACGLNPAFEFFAQVRLARGRGELLSQHAAWYSYSTVNGFCSDGHSALFGGVAAGNRFAQHLLQTWRGGGNRRSPMRLLGQRGVHTVKPVGEIVTLSHAKQFQVTLRSANRQQMANRCQRMAGTRAEQCETVQRPDGPENHSSDYSVGKCQPPQSLTKECYFCLLVEILLADGRN